MASLSVAGIVIKRFGGLTAFARALGHRNPTTIQRWGETGKIPSKHWPAVENAAFERGYLEFTVRWLGEAHANQEKALSIERDAKKNNERQPEAIV